MYRSLTHGCNGQGIHRARAISAGRLPTHSDPEAPPTREEVHLRILHGQLKVHESRLPLTRPALNSMLDYIQVQLNLPRGVNGGWSDQAEDRLADMLAKQKRGSCAMPLALLDASPGTPCPKRALHVKDIRQPPRLHLLHLKEALERGSGLHLHPRPRAPAPGKASCELQFENSERKLRTWQKASRPIKSSKKKMRSCLNSQML